jgi:ribosomal protein L11 methylase PrmA
VPKLVWDLGANDGRFSRIAARGGAYVVAIDGDEVAVDRLYRELRGEGSERILPLALDLVDSSPGMGWRGSERLRLEERGRPDLVLALALVHHLAIGANVPLAAVVDWLADLGAALVIEFPAREDPMVVRLLSRKREDAHPDYGLENFEALLERRFTVARREQLGSRMLFEARPR